MSALAITPDKVAAGEGRGGLEKLFSRRRTSCFSNARNANFVIFKWWQLWKLKRGNTQKYNNNECGNYNDNNNNNNGKYCNNHNHLDTIIIRINLCIDD